MLGDHLETLLSAKSARYELVGVMLSAVAWLSSLSSWKGKAFLDVDLLGDAVTLEMLLRLELLRCGKLGEGLVYAKLDSASSLSNESRLGRDSAIVRMGLALSSAWMSLRLDDRGVVAMLLYGIDCRSKWRLEGDGFGSVVCSRRREGRCWFRAGRGVR